MRQPAEEPELGNDDSTERAQAALRTAPANLNRPRDIAAAPMVEVLERLSLALDRVRNLEARASATESNLAAQQALLDERLLRIETSDAVALGSGVVETARRWIGRARHAVASLPLGAFRGKRLVRPADLANAQYLQWTAHEQAALPTVEQAREIGARWTRQPVLSLVLAARDTQALAETLASVQNQVYRNWQLCVAIPEGCQAATSPLLRQFAGDEDRIRYVVAREPLDEAAMRNAAAGLATGAYILFIEPAGVLCRFALFYIAESLQDGDFDLIYTDEDELDPGGHRTRPIFKPDWSPELLISCMYAGDLLAVRRECFLEAGGLRSQYAGAHLHDLALRLADRPLRVRHIARVLYHGRRIAGTAPEPGAEPQNDAATVSAIEDAVRRRGAPNPVAPGFAVARKQREEMTVVICSRSPQLLRRCLKALHATVGEQASQIIVVAHEDTGPNPELHSVIRQAGATAVSFGGAFNFSAMNNLGASLATKPHLLFLNDDIIATSPGWAGMLGEQLSREHVGVAGALLRYPSGAIQHAGIVVGIGDGVGHAGRRMNSSDLWPWLLRMRNVSAVTGACLAIRGELFQRLGGFDVTFPNNYNDADLCFRVRANGYEVVCAPVPGLIHFECQSRPGIVRFEERYRLYGRWMGILSRPDPYYSVSLSPTERIDLNSGADRWYRPMLTPEGR